MFEILVYLFENYYDPDECPDQDSLEKHLYSAGFEDQDIRRALDWLKELRRTADAEYPETLADNRSLRHYSEREVEKIDAAGRGFLLFLEQAGILNGLQRELVLDRALALGETQVGIAQIKLIVLMVLWSQKQPFNSLLLDELLSGEEPAVMH
ncbi:MAG: DUF494 domain-containing protein [Pseudomonadota bacterium]